LRGLRSLRVSNEVQDGSTMASLLEMLMELCCFRNILPCFRHLLLVDQQWHCFQLNRSRLFHQLTQGPLAPLEEFLAAISGRGPVVVDVRVSAQNPINSSRPCLSLLQQRQLVEAHGYMDLQERYPNHLRIWSGHPETDHTTACLTSMLDNQGALLYLDLAEETPWSAHTVRLLQPEQVAALRATSGHSWEDWQARNSESLMPQWFLNGGGSMTARLYSENVEHHA
jgi:hypothetical protein